jgi:biopolymer transport protein ExbB
MRRYSTSKARLVLFMILIGAILLSAGGGYAQSTAPSETPVASKPGMFSTLFGLIMENRDPIFFTILGCSVLAVTLIIKGFLQVRASVLLPSDSIEAIRQLIVHRKYNELLAFTQKDDSFVSKALNPALKRAPDFEAMKEAMETAIGEQTAEQFRRIEYLNIIGNLGPLLGLLGTVLGMIGAFAALHAAKGEARPDELAGGISAALTHTFLGLTLAVPCLAAFGVLRTMVDRLTIRGSLIAEEILLSLKPQEQKVSADAVVSVDA